MNALYAFLQVADGGGQAGQIARTFGVDWTHLGAQIISFGIVCLVLYKFAYGPVLAMLEERRLQIAQGLANAEKIKAELDRTEAQRQEVMAQAYAQAAKSVEEGRAAGARVLELETSKALAAAEQILIKAHEASTLDRDRMLAELKHDVGMLVVHAAASVTGKILTPEDHRRLAEETAKHLAA
jgi:F-type H+-transporting ATPase subunit b